MPTWITCYNFCYFYTFYEMISSIQSLDTKTWSRLSEILMCLRTFQVGLLYSFSELIALVIFRRN